MFDKIKDKAKEILQGFYGEILTLNENYENEVYDDTKAEEMYASTPRTSLDLNRELINIPIPNKKSRKGFN